MLGNLILKVSSESGMVLGSENMLTVDFVSRWHLFIQVIWQTLKISTEETNWKGINIIINCSQYIDAAWVERYWKLGLLREDFGILSFKFTVIILILRENVDCWAKFSGNKFIDLGSTLISFSN